MKPTTAAAFLGANLSGYDVILTAGQSNMQGAGLPIDGAGLDAPNGRIFQYALKGANINTIMQASEPLLGPGVGGTQAVGPALTFAKQHLARISSARKILIVPCAVGQTSLCGTGAQSWNPDDSSSLYQLSIDRANAAITAAGAGSRLIAMLWVQGENDTWMGINQTTYARYLDKLILGFRANIKTAHAKTPFVIGGMLPVFSPTQSAGIRAAQADTPNRLPMCAFSPGPTDDNGSDTLHYNAVNQRTQGRNMYAAFRALA